jgi:RNA recognition motif-containing protein
MQQNMPFYDAHGYPDAALIDQDDDNRDNSSAVQLRGLPYRASVNDIKAFLGSHVKELKEEIGAHAVQLVVNRDGRPSGFARLQFNSLEAAERCRDEVHMRTMEDRYVECFLYNDRPNKVNKKNVKDKVLEGNPEFEQPRPPKPPIDVSHVTREQVRQEVEEYMQAAGRNRLLLSMLGVALSQEARTFLKKIDQGLKNCLAQYPQIFLVEGTKGCETVSYLPGLEAEAEMRRNTSGGHEPASPSPLGVDRSSPQLGPVDRAQIKALVPFPARLQAELAAVGSPILGPTVPESCPLKVLHSGDGEDSPPGKFNRTRRLSPGPASSPQYTDSLGQATPKGFRTPSDWGTPAIGLDDGLGPAWAVPRQSKPQSPPPGISTFGGFGSAPQTCGAPQPWVAAPGMPLLPPFPSWQNLPPPMQGTWSTGLDPTASQAAQVERMVVEGIAATAAAAAAAASKGRDSPHQDEKEHDKENYGDDKAQLQVEKSGAHLHPQNHPFTELADGKNDALEDGLGAHIPVVRLRGLPFTASEQDVLAFFSIHNVTEGIADGDRAVRMLLKANGKPSGQAVVQMQNKAEADKAQKALHSQWMGSRYIEVFSYGGESEFTSESQNIFMSHQDEMPRSQVSEKAPPSAYPWTVPDDYAHCMQRNIGFSSTPVNAPLAWRPPFGGNSGNAAKNPNLMNGQQSCPEPLGEAGYPGDRHAFRGEVPYVHGEAAYIPTNSMENLEYISHCLLGNSMPGKIPARPMSAWNGVTESQLSQANLRNRQVPVHLPTRGPMPKAGATREDGGKGPGKHNGGFHNMRHNGGIGRTMDSHGSQGWPPGLPVGQ